MIRPNKNQTRILNHFDDVIPGGYSYTDPYDIFHHRVKLKWRDSGKELTEEEYKERLKYVNRLAQ